MRTSLARSMTPGLSGRTGVGSAVASIAIAAAAMAAALAATGAAAAVGLAALLATSAAVVGSGGGTTRSDAEGSDAAPVHESQLWPCWARYCSRHQDALDFQYSPAALSGGSGVQVLQSQAQGSQLQPCCNSDNARKVHFNLRKNTVHEITPYSEVYGVHPRFLSIDPGAAELQALPRGKADDSDSEDEDETTSSTVRRSFFQVCRKFVPLLAIAAFWLQAFGAQVLLDAFNDFAVVVGDSIAAAESSM